MEVQAVRQHLLGHMHPAQVAQIKHAPASDAEPDGLQPHDKHAGSCVIAGGLASATASRPLKYCQEV
jgi:hypothetical protein